MCEHTFSATGDVIKCTKCGKLFTRDEFIAHIKGETEPEENKQATPAKPKAPKKST